MRLGELNWMEVETLVRKDDRLIIVLGACEEHGYLSLLTDVKIPLSLADAASQRTGVLVAPPVNFGCSPYFTTYPGTISLRATTLMDLTEDIVRSVTGYGFKRLLFLNGHGGNLPAKARLNELINVLPGVKMAWSSWWMEPNVTEAAAKHGLKSGHANWIEAFSFVKAGDLPKGEKTPIQAHTILNAAETRKVYGDGVTGGLYEADEAIMDDIFAAALKDVLELLKFK